MGPIRSIAPALEAGRARFEAAAAQLSGAHAPHTGDAAAGPRTDRAAAAIELIEARHDVTVAARAFRRIAETTGSLLDVLA